MSDKLASPQPVERSIPVQAVPSSSTNVKMVEPTSIAERIEQIRASIERRAFELFMDDGAADGNDIDHWIQAEMELLHPMHLSVAESKDALTVKAELPGFRANEIHVSLETRRLTISGKRESSGSERNGKTIYQERCSSEILRSLDLMSDVDVSKTTATLKDGVLELVMPKVVEAKASEVQAKAAASGA
jgi:HSP20 family molecular chaperone IbpA